MKQKTLCSFALWLRGVFAFMNFLMKDWQMLIFMNFCLLLWTCGQEPTLEILKYSFIFPV